MSSPTSEPVSWLPESLLSHEPMLRAWLQKRFPGGCDIDDIVQESYVRVLRARERREIESPKAFLFATARNLALDHFRRAKTIREDCFAEIDPNTVLDESETIPDSVSRHQELELLHHAVASLPERCRQIFAWRKIHGLSPREIAERLGISEHTVSAQLTIGLYKCTEYLERYRRETRP